MRPSRGSNRSSATANVTLYCTWCPSGLTIGLHGQGQSTEDILSLVHIPDRSVSYSEPLLMLRECGQ